MVLDLMDISVLKGKVWLIVFLTVSSVFSNEVIQKKYLNSIHQNVFITIMCLLFSSKMCLLLSEWLVTINSLYFMVYYEPYTMSCHIFHLPQICVSAAFIWCIPAVIMNNVYLGSSLS